MRNVPDAAKMESMIAEVLAEDFRDVNILRVKVHKDMDSDGDDVLRIDVIFEGKRRDVDTRRFSGAVRAIRPRLIDGFGEMAFPLMSFISKRDAGRHRLEPA